MKCTSKLTIAIAMALLTTSGGPAVYAQDKYSLKSPSGIAFSDFKGYEDWAVVSSARTDSALLFEADYLAPEHKLKRHRMAALCEAV